MNGRYVSICIQFAYTPGDTSGYKWIHVSKVKQCSTRGTQVDTDTFCIRYKWIQMDTSRYMFYSVDTTGYNLYPVVFIQV